MEVAISFTQHCAARCLEENATDPTLREWHELLRDIAVGLEDEYPHLAKPLNDLAGKVHTAVRLATRNPIGAIADRPPVRQVLEAIYSLGDGSEQSDVRARTSQGQSHFSNILSLLKGYGLVSSMPSRSSGRNRCLALTAKGRDFLLAAREDGKLPIDIHAPAPEALPRLERAGSTILGYRPPFPVRKSVYARAERQPAGV